MKNKKKKKIEERKNCSAKTKKKNLTMKKKKFLNEIEKKRWFEGWVVLMADGYGKKRVA